MEIIVDSVREITVTTEMETEMAADLAREDHRVDRDVSMEEMTEEMKEEMEAAAKVVSEADRTIRDSVPAVQEEAAEIMMQSSLQS